MDRVGLRHCLSRMIEEAKVSFVACHVSEVTNFGSGAEIPLTYLQAFPMLRLVVLSASGLI